MPAHKSNVSDQKIAALAYAIAANHHPANESSLHAPGRTPHLARPHSTEQRRSPAPATTFTRQNST